MVVLEKVCETHIPGPTTSATETVWGQGQYQCPPGDKGSTMVPFSSWLDYYLKCIQFSSKQYITGLKRNVEISSDLLESDTIRKLRVRGLHCHYSRSDSFTVAKVGMVVFITMTCQESFAYNSVFSRLQH